VEPFACRNIPLCRTQILVAAFCARGKTGMVHAAYLYMVVIVLSVGTVASYFIPLP
jgi:hypothetical protein